LTSASSLDQAESKEQAADAAFKTPIKKIKS